MQFSGCDRVPFAAQATLAQLVLYSRSSTMNPRPQLAFADSCDAVPDAIGVPFAAQATRRAGVATRVRSTMNPRRSWHPIPATQCPDAIGVPSLHKTRLAGAGGNGCSRSVVDEPGAALGVNQ